MSGWTSQSDQSVRSYRESALSLLPLLEPLIGGTLSGGSIAVTRGESAFGEPARADASSSLCGPNVGLERSERAVTSASSFRRASSSLSNLSEQILAAARESWSAENSLAPEDFDVETAAVPDAHREEQKEIRRAPECAVVKQEHGRKLGYD